MEDFAEPGADPNSGSSFSVAGTPNEGSCALGASGPEDAGRKERSGGFARAFRLSIVVEVIVVLAALLVWRLLVR